MINKAAYIQNSTSDNHARTTAISATICITNIFSYDKIL